MEEEVCVLIWLSPACPCAVWVVFIVRCSEMGLPWKGVLSSCVGDSAAKPSARRASQCHESKLWIRSLESLWRRRYFRAIFTHELWKVLKESELDFVKTLTFWTCSTPQEILHVIYILTTGNITVHNPTQSVKMTCSHLSFTRTLCWGLCRVKMPFYV